MGYPRSQTDKGTTLAGQWSEPGMRFGVSLPRVIIVRTEYVVACECVESEREG